MIAKILLLILRVTDTSLVLPSRITVNFTVSPGFYFDISMFLNQYHHLLLLSTLVMISPTFNSLVANFATYTVSPSVFKSFYKNLEYHLS